MRGGAFTATRERTFGGGVATAAPERQPVQQRTIHVSAFNEKPNLRRMSDVTRDFSAPRSSHAALSVGAIVQHDRFGVGEVLTTEGAGENAKATIKFKNAGVKTLLLKFAKLKTIE